MTSRTKKIFLFFTIVVPFILYCVYYYGMMIKNAPYRFSDFDSITFEFGPKDSLVNKFNSKTGDYQYIDRKDSLVKKHIRLTSDDLLYLHRKAADLGFWDFPSNEIGDTTKNSKALRFIIQYKYKDKTKRVIYDRGFFGNPKLKDANEQLIKEIQQSLDAASARLNKKQ